MPRHSFFGPMSGSCPAGLQRDRQAGRCLVFGDGPGLNIVISAGATWPTIEGRLPGGWRPDFVLLDLASRTIPAWPWSAPVPVIGLVPAVGLASSPDRRAWRRCDRILAGTVADRARSCDSPADRDDLFAAIDREWPEIVLLAAGRRAAGGAGWPITALEWALDDDPFDLDSARGSSRPWAPPANSDAVANLLTSAGSCPRSPRTWCRRNPGSRRLPTRR